MKNRYLYILGIIIILIGVVVWEQISINTYLKIMENKITEIIINVKDETNINKPEIYNSITELESTWDSYETTLCFMVNLKDIEDIGIEITKMKTYIVENATTDFKSSLSLLLFFIDSYYNLTGISFENIF